MKKLLLTMLGLVLCVAANAADYYLIGGFNNWALKADNCKFTANGDGSYELDYNGMLTNEFKINDGTWGDNGIWGSDGSDLVLGQTFTLTAGPGSKNITIAAPIVNPHLVFNPTAKTLLITGETGTSTITYCIHGQIVTGNWEDIALTENDGKWVLDKQQLKAGEFGIRKLENGSPAGWISADGSANVVIGTPMKAKFDGSNFKLGTAGEYTFTFDPIAMTVLIAGDGETPEPTPSTSITIEGDYNLAYSGDKENVYYWPVSSPSWPGDQMETAIASDGKTYKVFKLPEGTTGLVFNTNGDSNKTGDINYTAGYVFDDNGATSTAVTFTTGETPDPETDYSSWYVNVFGPFNDWKDNGVQPVDGISLHADLQIGINEFKVKIWDGEKDIYYSTGSAIAQNVWVTIEGDVDQNMTIVGATQDQKFNVEWDCATKAIRVTPVVAAGVNDIIAVDNDTDVVYYNLQGVRVAQPTNGLFIRVANGKTSKVLVK